MTRTIHANDRMALCPVLEVEPYMYANLPTPVVGSARLHPSEWDDYFQACMTEAGFRDVHPIKPGSSFVSARSLIGNRLLERVVRDAIGDQPWPRLDGTDQVSALSGGLALIDAGVVLLEPSCCGDLGDLQSWEAALARRPVSGDIWAGHPAIGIAFDHDRVTLTERWEYPPPPDDLVEVTMPVASLLRAITDARFELERFRSELLALVTRVVGAPELTRVVLDALVGAAIREG